MMIVLFALYYVLVVLCHVLVVPVVFYHMLVVLCYVPTSYHCRNPKIN